MGHPRHRTTRSSVSLPSLWRMAPVECSKSMNNAAGDWTRSSSAEESWGSWWMQGWTQARNTPLQKKTSLLQPRLRAAGRPREGFPSLSIWYLRVWIWNSVSSSGFAGPDTLECSVEGHCDDQEHKDLLGGCKDDRDPSWSCTITVRQEVQSNWQAWRMEIPFLQFFKK